MLIPEWHQTQAHRAPVRGQTACARGAGARGDSCQPVPRPVLAHPRIVVRSLLTRPACQRRLDPSPEPQRRQYMKVRSSVIALGAAAVLGGAGAIAVPALASAHPVTHTLKF